MGEAARDTTDDPLAIEGLDDVFDLTGTTGAFTGTESGTTDEKSGTVESDDPGQPGHVTLEPSKVVTYISTSEAGKSAGVDSRTVRRWYEQKKVRGQFSKGKLLIAREDLPSVDDSSEILTAGTSGTESGTSDEQPGTVESDDPGQPGQSTDIPQTPAIVFSDFLDRIERLSRENGELKALLDEERRENRELKMLTDSRRKRGSYWHNLLEWFLGRTSEVP